MKSWKKYLLIFGFWVALGILYGTQNYLFYSLEEVKCNLFNTLLDQVPNFVLWGLYTPFILFLREKFPFHGNKRLRNILGVHIPALLIISFGHILILGSIRWFIQSKTDPIGLVDYLHSYSSAWLYFQLLIYGLIILAGYLMEYYEKYRKKEETNIMLEKLLVDSELQVLKDQLQPHFLFNTLNTISMLIRQNEDEKATKIVANLSTLLREILEKRYTHWSPLSNEITFVRKYLEIMSIRFRDKITFNINVEDGLEDVMMPDFLLQPIVENSIKHGLSNKKEKGKVTIDINSLQDYIEIKILDDGTGFDSDNYREGVGISNLKERLSKLYIDDYDFSINSVPGKGTVVRLKLPANPKIEKPGHE